ncbi:multicomponent Na+:H+ antiporter subunit F [Amorphus suaedae]
MIDVSIFLEICIDIAFALLSISFILIVYRIATGPTLPDRILALDMMVAVAIGFIATFGVRSGFYLYVDIAIALGLIGFLSTVAFARFLLARGSTEDSPVGRDDGEAG